MLTDDVLYTQIMEKLKFEPGIEESNITVSIKEDGIIILGGKVHSYTEKRLAEEAVQKIGKVRGVANELIVELIPSYKRSDADIVSAALSALKWTLLIPHEKIKVAVENGHLVLSGEIEYNYQKERAQKAVQDLYGVTSVTNNIKVKPSVDAVQVKGRIIKEFERNARIDANHVEIEVDGGKVILKGKVRNFDEAREARAAAWAVPGVSEVIDKLTISW